MNKRNKETITIATHNGVFHADEVFAIALWKIFINNNILIIRTRDEKTILKCDVLIDIGEKSDKRKYFDHHQWSSNKKTHTYSSAGLVWNYINKETQYNNISNLVKDIDNQDLGLKKQTPFHFCNLIASFQADDIYSKEQDISFIKAVDFAKEIILGLKRKSELNIKRKQIIKKIKPILQGKGNNISISILKEKIFIPSTFLVGKTDILIQYEKEENCWLIQIVPIKINSFERKYKLIKTKNKNEIFVHKDGFLAKIKSNGNCLTFCLSNQKIKLNIQKFIK